MSKKQDLAVIQEDMNVTAIIATLDAQLKQMEKVKSTVYQTSGNISPEFPNIKDEKNNENLIKALSVVKTRAAAYDEAATASTVDGFGLGLSEYPIFKLNGFTLEQWHHDIYTRYQINNQEQIEQKVSKYRDALKEFISKEERQANLVKDIIKDFGNGMLMLK